MPSVVRPSRRTAQHASVRAGPTRTISSIMVGCVAQILPYDVSDSLVTRLHAIAHQQQQLTHSSGRPSTHKQRKEEEEKEGPHISRT